MDWINIYGLIIVILMLLPNMIYAFKNKNIQNKSQNKAMNIIEQIGRYGCMFLMVFNIGIVDFSFHSDESFASWLILTTALLLFYWIFWIIYFIAPKNFISIMLAIIPTIIFISNGLFLSHWLLMLFGIAFGVGHLYVTYQNTCTN